MCTDCDELTQGVPGYNGWSPLFQTVIDNVNLDEDGNPRVVLQLTGWTGGEGPTPTTNVGQYLTTSGYTSDISLGTNIKGPQGEQGIQGEQGEPGISGLDGTDLSQEGPPVEPGDFVGQTSTDTLTGEVWTWNGTTWELTSISIVNPTSVLGVGINGMVDKSCLTSYIFGNTLEDYLQGVILALCNTGLVPPYVEPEVTYEFSMNFSEEEAQTFANWDEVDNVGMTFSTIDDDYLIPAVIGLVEGVTLFTVGVSCPSTVTSLQFELYSAGGGVALASETAGAVVIKSDNTVKIWAKGAVGDNGGTTNAGTATPGINGSFTTLPGYTGYFDPGTTPPSIYAIENPELDQAGELGTGPLAFNYGDILPAATAFVSGTSGYIAPTDGTPLYVATTRNPSNEYKYASGAYGKFTVPVVNGDSFAVVAKTGSGTAGVIGDNKDSLIIVSWNA